MLSKLLVSQCRAGWRGIGLTPGLPLVPSPAAIKLPIKVPLRFSGDMIPPSQYDMPLSNKFKPTYALVHYWELIPMFVVTGISLLILFLSIAWASKNKVDVVYTTHSRENISRTMDLRNPSAHKIVRINQQYEPWPEMQRVLDLLKFAEKRELSRRKKCFPQ